MRKILFRALSKVRKEDDPEDEKNPKWLYGNLSIFKEEAYIGVINRRNPDDFSWVSAIRETLGQYIGINCKGEKIFEGDIVETHFTEKIRCRDNKKIKKSGFAHYQIGFFKGGFCRRVIAQENCYYGKIPSNWASLFFSEEFTRIIGNIHDNPELLETK